MESSNAESGDRSLHRVADMPVITVLNWGSFTGGFTSEADIESWQIDAEEKENLESRFDRELVDMIKRDVIQAPCVRWEDVVGLEQAKKLLKETVALPIQVPDVPWKAVVRCPWKGVLLVGPSGTGKRMLAEAVATENKMIFFHFRLSALTYCRKPLELSRLLFEMAKLYSPSVIYINRIDVLCSELDEVGQKIKAEFLKQMDVGMSRTEDASKVVMVLTSSNSPWEIDEDFLSRLEKRIYVPLPNADGREAMVKMNLGGYPESSKLCVKELADSLTGFSGMDIKYICNYAFFMAAGDNIINTAPQGTVNFFLHLIDPNEFKEAVQCIKRAVRKANPEDYKRWMLEFAFSLKQEY